MAPSGDSSAASKAAAVRVLVQGADGRRAGSPSSTWRASAWRSSRSTAARPSQPASVPASTSSARGSTIAWGYSFFRQPLGNHGTRSAPTAFPSEPAPVRQLRRLDDAGDSADAEPDVAAAHLLAPL